MYNDFTTKLLLENCSSFAERREIFSLTESEINGVQNGMINKLYTSALNKAHVDFEDIPESKGDITKYSGYKPMVETLQILSQLAERSKQKIPEIAVVQNALDNIVSLRDLFEKGFKLNKEFIILQYNSLVSSCVISTSSLISSYVDYMKNVNNVEFIIINPKNNSGKICINSLKDFNKSVISGEFRKVLNVVINNDSEAFLGTATVITTIVIASVIATVIIMRNIIFYIYYSRVKIAEYMRVQALFLELNKSSINSQSYNVPASKKKEVLKKQKRLINELKKIADQIDVSDRMATNNLQTNMKKENSSWKLDDVKPKNQVDQTGFQLI